MRHSSTGRSPQKQTEPVAHLAAALAYASAGIHVFPLAPRSKVPLISARNGGHGLHDATTNDLIIRSWWTHQYPVVTYVTPVPRPLGGRAPAVV